MKIRCLILSNVNISCFIKGLVAVSGVSLVSKWAPIYERSIFLTVGMSGISIRALFTVHISFLVHHHISV